MDDKILVTYATTFNATKEIAEMVAGVLHDCGAPVDLLPARQVKSLDGYSAVVLGTGLYAGRMHGDVRRFLSRFRSALTHLPLAVFGGGPIGIADTDPVAMRKTAREQVDKEIARFAWLNPVSVEVVGGRWTSTDLRFPYNLIPGLKMIPISDLRDWDAIRAWAAELPALFAAARENRVKRPAG